MADDQLGNQPHLSGLLFGARGFTIKRLLSIPKYLFLFIIRAYQVLVSPYLPKSCRFMPTCSEYGRQAFTKYNPFKALYLTVWRVLRCNPFNPGGYDPLP